MIKKILKIAPALALILFISCENHGRIKGNQDVEKEVRKMVPFGDVINEGSFNVIISNDSVYEVTVEAESNIIPYIRTNVNGNSLIIDTQKNISANYPINIYVKSPLVKYVAMQGSGKIVFDSLSCKTFKADLDGSGYISGKILADSVYTNIDGSGNISLVTNCSDIVTGIDGSGNINLQGSTDAATHEISGSGNINAYGFVTKNCKAAISGSGNMKLYVTDKFDVNISGSGSVLYMGNPQMNVNITGSGRVIKQ